MYVCSCVRVLNDVALLYMGSLTSVCQQIRERERERDIHMSHAYHIICSDTRDASSKPILPCTRRYDGEFFNTTSNHMQLYDVGMSSMVAMELKALANLSVTAFDPPRTKVCIARTH